MFKFASYFQLAKEGGELEKIIADLEKKRDEVSSIIWL